MKSDNINELATALCKMQGTLEDTAKSSPAYNYKYSDLSSILTYIRPIMAENGLSVTQLVNGDNVGQIGVETILMHVSGQWVSTNAAMSVQGQNLAQEAGKICTYLRRYSLAAIIGLTQKDEDAVLSKEKPKNNKPEPSQDCAKYIKRFKACNDIDSLHSAYNDAKNALPDAQHTFINNAVNHKKKELAS